MYNSVWPSSLMSRLLFRFCRFQLIPLLFFLFFGTHFPHIAIIHLNLLIWFVVIKETVFILLFANLSASSHTTATTLIKLSLIGIVSTSFVNFFYFSLFPNLSLITQNMVCCCLRTSMISSLVQCSEHWLVCSSRWCCCVPQLLSLFVNVFALPGDK